MQLSEKYLTPGTRYSFWICVAILLGCYVITIYAGLSDPELYARLLSEDGPLENLATACTFIAAVLFLLAFVRHQQPRSVFLLLFSLLLFLVFMEEISWGQRFFDLETPDSLKHLNAQGELNLHNYSPIYKYVNGVAYVCLDFYFIGIPLLLFIIKRLHPCLLKLGIPVPSPATALLTFLNFLLYTYFFVGFLSHHGNLGQGKINYGEILETSIELTLLLFSFECFSRGITWLKVSDKTGR